MYHVSYNGIFKLKLVIDLIDELSCDVIGSTKREKQITNKQVFSWLSTFDMGKFRGPCVRKLFTGLIMYLPSQNKEHCIVLYCIVLRKICWKECLSVSTIAKFESALLETIQHVFIKIAKFYRRFICMVGDTNFPPPYKRLTVNFCNFAELYLPSLRT